MLVMNIIIIIIQVRAPSNDGYYFLLQKHIVCFPYKWLLSIQEEFQTSNLERSYRTHHEAAFCIACTLFILKVYAFVRWFVGEGGLSPPKAYPCCCPCLPLGTRESFRTELSYSVSWGQSQGRGSGK